MEPVPPADMKTGFYSPYFIVPKKGGGWRPILDLRVLNWASFRSRDSRRSASSGASVPEIGLQRLTWRTCTSLSQSFRTTGHSCGLRLKDGHISTRSCPSSCPCHPVSSRKLWRQPLFPWENRAFAFSTTSTTGSCCLSLRTSCANTGTWCSCTLASWAFGSTGKRANSPRRRGSLFSVWNWIRSIRQHASRRNVLSRCWTAWMRSRAGPRSHWNNFRGSWGIWQLRRQWRRWGCFIWDRFNTGSMAESRGGRGNAALTGSKSHRPAAKPSPRGQTFRFSGQECPWNRSLGMLWFTRMPPPPAGAPRSTGLQCRVWTGPPTALAHKLPRVAAVHLPLNRLKRRLQGKHVLIRMDTLWPLHTSTDKVVYASVACRNLPATSSYGVRSIWGRFVPFTFRACSTGQPTSCHELRSPESGDSIPRRPSLLRDFSLPVVYSLTEETLGTECTGTQLAAGPPQVCVSPSEHSRTDTVQDQGGRGAGLARGAVLAHSDLVPRTDAPRDSPSLADSSEVGSTDSETGRLMAPASRPLET